MGGRHFSKGIFALWIISFVVIFSNASAGAPRPGDPAVYNKLKKDIAKYHFKDKKYTCGACHKDGQNGDFRLIRVESDLCHKCHKRVDEAEWAHGPVGAGQCSVCHNPHGSEKPNFLVRKGNSLCFYCHDEARLREHVEDVEKEICVSCHDPHSSDDSSLLQ